MAAFTIQMVLWLEMGVDKGEPVGVAEDISCVHRKVYC